MYLNVKWREPALGLFSLLYTLQLWSDTVEPGRTLSSLQQTACLYSRYSCTVPVTLYSCTVQTALYSCTAQIGTVVYQESTM